MKFRTLLTVAALATPVTVSAMGSGSSHDDKIEWSESKAVGVPKKLFKQDDFNHTGKLTKSEWYFVRIEMPARLPLLTA